MTYHESGSYNRAGGSGEDWVIPNRFETMSGKDPMGYYLALGISREASKEEIKSAWLRLSNKHHPNPPENRGGNLDRFTKVQEAWAILGNSAKRSLYDNEQYDQLDFRFPKSPLKEKPAAETPEPEIEVDVEPIPYILDVPYKEPTNPFSQYEPKNTVKSWFKEAKNLFYKTIYDIWHADTKANLINIIRTYNKSFEKSHPETHTGGPNVERYVIREIRIGTRDYEVGRSIGDNVESLYLKRLRSFKKGDVVRLPVNGGVEEGWTLHDVVDITVDPKTGRDSDDRRAELIKYGPDGQALSDSNGQVIRKYITLRELRSYNA